MQGRNYLQAIQRAKQLRQAIDEREEEISRANTKVRKLQREVDDKQEMIDTLTRENSKLRATSRSVWFRCWDVPNVSLTCSRITDSGSRGDISRFYTRAPPSSESRGSRDPVDDAMSNCSNDYRNY